MEYRFIGIQIDRVNGEADVNEYRRTWIYDADLSEHASFASGDPVEDFAAATEYCAASDFQGVYVVASSIDDLVFDIPGYRFDPDAGEYGAVVNDPADRPAAAPSP